MAKSYTLNEYYPHTISTSTRVEIYNSNAAATALLIHHKKNGVYEIPVFDCDCVGDSLPMPNVLMTELDAKIMANGNRVIITGIDGYMSLLNEKNANVFMNALYNRIDEGKLNAIYLLCSTYFDDTKFKNPKYENALSIVYISNNGQHFEKPRIILVSDKWLRKGENPTSWKQLLMSLGKFEPNDEKQYTLILHCFKTKQAGLSDNVSQLLDICEIAKRLYGLDVSLSKSTLETFAEKIKDSNTTPIDVLNTEFGQENINVRNAVKRLLDFRNDAMWSAYVWLLQKKIDVNTYLARVLNENPSADGFLKQYVFESTIKILLESNTERYTVERANAIKELNGLADSLIIEFISCVKSESADIIAPWLNCEIEAERVEIIRRVAESDLSVGLPQIWRGLYLSLADYLNDDYDYADNGLTEYFRDYRRLKISNTITTDFVKRAFNAVLPSTFVTRDSVLQEFSADCKTALLVVDGMGAEYYPLVLAMAKRRGMDISSHVVASVRLPSSTHFNYIKWEQSRILSPVSEIDNISHYGAVAHEHCSFEKNLVATLKVFDEIFNRIARGLTSYDRVVVTADHGCSRLAVIAHEQKLSVTLPWDGEPQDWRFSFAPQNTERPREFEAYYDANRNMTYWAVRGYNRLPKKGGKLCVHGGATLEERLVPVIVFTKAKAESVTMPNGKTKVEQLVERMGFDEI